MDPPAGDDATTAASAEDVELTPEELAARAKRRLASRNKLTSSQQKAMFVNLTTASVKGDHPGFFVVDKEGEDLTLTEDFVDPKGTIYFKGCKNCNYTVDVACTRLFVERCESVAITLNRKILTSTVEIWRTSDLSFHCNVRVDTFQLDLSTGLSLRFNEMGSMGNLVWAGVRKLDISFLDSKKSISTGYDELKKMPMYEDINDTSDQFILRIIDGKLFHERVVRVGEGYLTTAREKKIHEAEEERNRKLAEEHAKMLIREKMKADLTKDALGL